MKWGFVKGLRKTLIQYLKMVKGLRETMVKTWKGNLKTGKGFLTKSKIDT